MSNDTEARLRVSQPVNLEVVHAAGLANPNWPLCLEAEARGRGYSAEDIADGEFADSDDDDFELNDGGFWVTTCSDCLALVHA